MKPIPNHPNYFADETGNVYRIKSDGTYRKLKPFVIHRNKRHLQVTLRDAEGVPKNRFVHHLILEAFVGAKPTPKHIARHLNDIANDNRLENLCWGTQADNKADFYLNRTTKKSRKVQVIKKALSLGLTLDEVSILSNWSQGKIKELLEEV